MTRTSSWVSLRKGASVLALIGAVLVAAPAFANGGDFFDEFVTAAGQPRPNVGSPFFGFVRDQHGKAIPRAMVTISVGTDDEQNLTILADALGHYRFPGFDKSVDPKTVNVQCSKVGYRQTVASRRVQKGAPANAPIEVDCTLASAGG
jgi:hypothetical protein